MVHSIPPRSQAVLFCAALAAVALALSGSGLSFISSTVPVLSPVVRPDMPYAAWSGSWSNIQPVSVQTASPSLHRPRPLAVRAATDGATLFLLVEWFDTTSDLGYEGAFYSNWIHSGREMAPESTLLRDELLVLLGPAVPNGSPSSFQSAESDHGHWIWRSQWQHDRDRDAMATLRKENGTPYVDSYPLKGDGAFAARYAQNTNAISQSDPCKWIVKPARDVYTPPVTRPLDGEGRWHDDRWRVLFKVPISSLLTLGGRLELSFRITDGGLGERGIQAPVSSPCVIDLASIKERGHR